MPQEFDNCIKRGGKVRTVKVKGSSKYFHICFIGGKSFRGEIKENKSGKRKPN